MKKHVATVLTGLALSLLSASALAASIAGFSPQGEIARVRQVRATFSEPAIAFGDPKTENPFDIQCSAAGSGRWADEKNWIYDFNQDLGPGSKCSFQLKPGFKLKSGATVTGKTQFQFNTGGPSVSRILPYTGNGIEEDQVFMLFQTGAATEASIKQHTYCEISGVQERVPVKLINGDVRKKLLENFAKGSAAEAVTTLQCQQKFPAEADVKLVWDKGIATTSGIITSSKQEFRFKVRKDFTASMSCQRENANAACTPILPIQLYFSEGISRKLAEKIVLKSAKGSVKPDLPKAEENQQIQSLSFTGPFPEKMELSIELPSDLKDESGRALANAGQFPKKFMTADFPPLAKFPAAPFGIVELNADATLAVTLRNVENDILLKSADGKQPPVKLANLKLAEDASIIEWIAKLNNYHETSIYVNKEAVETRSLSLLKNETKAVKLNLPSVEKKSERPFEVVGIPFKDPGFYVLELESLKLGSALLGKTAPMYVRTSALVTNLAVHIKTGRENGAVWVTQLDNGKVVPDAAIQVSDCSGELLWKGKTDSKGIAMLPAGLNTRCEESSGRAGKRKVSKINGYFVSARKQDAQGRMDMAFALSSWNNGIESFRFNLPTDFSPAATLKAHTILDRSLFRAGETVSMKHVFRAENMKGLAFAGDTDLPKRVRIIHQGSGQEFQFPLSWRKGGVADNRFAIPAQAKLGQYDILLDHGTAKTNTTENEGGENAPMYGSRTYSSGSFRVEEFRLPLMQGKLIPPKGPHISPKELPLGLQLNYINGGGAALPVQVTSLLRNKFLQFSGYEQFTFNNVETEEESQKIVANKLAVTLDKNGSGKTVIGSLPAITQPQELLTEMTYADPNGEIQTISNVTALWPAAVVVGIKSEDWVSAKNKTRFILVALDTAGKPLADVPLQVNGTLRLNNSHRKRIVGGFYAYENAESSKDLGQLCSGKSDQRGLLLCEIELKESGNVELVAKAKDASGKVASAKSSIWATGKGEVWFDGENQDRMDVLPEKKHYKAGEVAKFQVRMPFRSATALVAIEREGVIETIIAELRGSDPSISVPIKAEYGPNVFVSVLAVRGRMREVPWYSFFSWGWKEPINWWHEFREYQAPTATVDLAKPAYKFGVAEIQVGTEGNQLKVNVSADKQQYPIRAVSKVKVSVTLPDGRPAAGAEVAIAAVDEALLELQPNESWNVLSAMIQRRSYGIETATAQMQVIGKRHYGRKAVAAGGGGGKAPTRELLDTLLLWKPDLVLDANGQASIDVPLNDALTSFRIVAVAQSGASQFGTGTTAIKATQDLQIIPGLPPVVREGDSYQAMVTVRNSSARAMEVLVQGKILSANALPDQKVKLAAGESRELSWTVQAPELTTDVLSQQLQWELSAKETAPPQGQAAVADAIKWSQKLLPATPVTVQQATMLQLDRSMSLPIAQPADSLPGRGGLQLHLLPSLLNSGEGLKRYFESYPYSCLEQKTSKAIGLHDNAMWQKIVNDLPTYLDADGLAYYYPPSDSAARLGSDTLTSYLISVTHEAGLSLPDSARQKMLAALSAFVEGKITRDFWSPRKDLETRKLAALEALSRYGMVQPRMLGSIQITPNLWTTSAILDWYAILKRTTAIPNREAALKEADQILRSRLNYQGTRLGFSTEKDDYWWWLMSNTDVNANRLLLTMIDNPAWKDDLPKLVNGSIQRQHNGVWMTTNANVWGLLALEKFARQFETEKVAGTSKAMLLQTPTATPVPPQSFNWSVSGGGKLNLPWPVKPAADDKLSLSHEGKGKPWIVLQSLAAVPLKTAFSSGYRIKKTITPVEQKDSKLMQRGDVFRITLEIDAQTDMTWVALTDPVPAGASVLGSGLGRDSAIATKDDSNEQGGAWLAYEERSFEAYRAYYQFVPKGKFVKSYTIRLNNAGQFKLPPTRVEAMYAPEMFGESPNVAIQVK
ncbi:alpha-2-macroglobulin family protein [Undibacterium rugosum]|uniref:Alpha-2-macroglobulin n=2 Tax=Undibacterium TaxID=401469 RepID=A0A923KZD1_9BURK|nr:MG2 domain-containing protein [Undibacterium rugosum]MBC3935870.1 alpha-2-macroglobulin [Undibacterium rugosum]MBR7779348.1 alpha-2-macroglobulin [Undibacterium rugosum]